ncbi:hypothetical protein AB0M97_19480 [Streptomyces sp. NPDC051207]|uniref:hypothetical protein n=1 Tax=Streptomyces sp. NPDC051207 TaxID=3154641 RepID=UPI0034204772
MAQTELAVKASYYMVTAGTMALQTEGSGAARAQDSRSAVGILRAMLSQRRGVIQAYKVVRAGRLGRPLHEVDEDGGPICTDDGGYRELTDALVRHTYNGEALTEAVVGLPAARARWTTVTKSVDNLRQAVSAMESVPAYESGDSLVKREGWDPPEIEKARRYLDKVSRTLADWADWYHEQNDEQGQGADIDATDVRDL